MYQIENVTRKQLYPVSIAAFSYSFFIVPLKINADIKALLTWEHLQYVMRVLRLLDVTVTEQW